MISEQLSRHGVDGSKHIAQRCQPFGLCQPGLTTIFRVWGHSDHPRSLKGVMFSSYHLAGFRFFRFHSNPPLATVLITVQPIASLGRVCCLRLPPIHSQPRSFLPQRQDDGGQIKFHIVTFSKSLIHTSPFTLTEFKPLANANKKPFN